VTNVMLRISDSLAFVAAARAVYAVIPDDENQRKLIVRGKNNLAPAARDKTLAYNITVSTVNDPDSGVTTMAPHILWQPKHVEVTATEAMQAAADDRSPAQIESAMHFLTDLLSEGAVEHGEVNEAAEVERIAARTLRRASDKLGVEKRKQKGAMTGKWYWRLPNTGHPWPWEVRGRPFGFPDTRAGTACRGLQVHHTRHLFSEAFMRDLSASWGMDGPKVLARAAKENPSGYFSVCARLLPSDVAISIQRNRQYWMLATYRSCARSAMQSRTRTSLSRRRCCNTRSMQSDLTMLAD
jgi:hypothetical protein